jgi:hypothetical protein
VLGGRLTTRDELDGRRLNVLDALESIRDVLDGRRCCALGGRSTIRDEVRRCCVLDALGSTRDALDGRRLNVLGGRLTTRDEQDGRRLNEVRGRRGLGHGRQSHRDRLDDLREVTSHGRCLGVRRGFRVERLQTHDVRGLLLCSAACGQLRREGHRCGVVHDRRGHLREV